LNPSSQELWTKLLQVSVDAGVGRCLEKCGGCTVGTFFLVITLRVYLLEELAACRCKVGCGKEWLLLFDVLTCLHGLYDPPL
jgi:hypothetical protein